MELKQKTDKQNRELGKYRIQQKERGQSSARSLVSPRLGNRTGENRKPKTTHSNLHLKHSTQREEATNDKYREHERISEVIGNQ